MVVRAQRLVGGPRELVDRPRLHALPTPSATVRELRRLERDLHDGVQNELVGVIVKLSVLSQDPATATATATATAPALADELRALEARAQAALDSVRDIARGIYPQVLADFGVDRALRAQTARAPVDVTVRGSAPRSADEAEAAVYFSCLEAIQNVAKHAGEAARVTMRLDHDHGTLTVRIEDNGRGFDPRRTPRGAGLRNIDDRAQAVDGGLAVASARGAGTTLTISLPWPPA
jgi:signal transduction histidine kinase